MHETALLTEVVRLVETQLQRTPASRVVTVRVRVRPSSHLCGHDAGVLASSFAMVVAGSRLEGATLELDIDATQRACGHCGRIMTADEVDTSCGICGSITTDTLTMPEVTVHEIVVEE